VAFVNVATPSGASGATGEWPDALLPIGTDRFHGESRNGAPFALPQDRSQPVWIDVRVPRTALPGDYQATFTVMDGAGGVLGSLPVRLTVFAAELPFKSFLPTSYGFVPAAAVGAARQGQGPGGAGGDCAAARLGGTAPFVGRAATSPPAQWHEAAARWVAQRSAHHCASAAKFAPPRLHKIGQWGIHLSGPEPSSRRERPRRSNRAVRLAPEASQPLVAMRRADRPVRGRGGFTRASRLWSG
jgi:hypothetical protein